MKNKNNIIILVAVVLIVAFTIMYLGKSSSDDASLGTDIQSADSADAKYVYSLLQKMSFVRLDDSIFSSELFINLKDNTVTLNQQQVGRPNPFAPIGNDSGTFSTTSKR